MPAARHGQSIGALEKKKVLVMGLGDWSSPYTSYTPSLGAGKNGPGSCHMRPLDPTEARPKCLSPEELGHEPGRPLTVLAKDKAPTGLCLLEHWSRGQNRATGEDPGLCYSLLAGRLPLLTLALAAHIGGLRALREFLQEHLKGSPVSRMPLRPVLVPGPGSERQMGQALRLAG